MKHLKTFIAATLTMLVAFAMAIPAFAEGNTITITNAKDGETYNAYKMLDLSANAAVGSETDPTAYRYTVNEDWTNFFSEANKAAWEDVFTIDDQGYVTSSTHSESAWSASSALSKFAEAAAKYAKDNNISAAASEEASGDSVVLTTADAGYYLVTSTLGTRAMIDTTPGNVTMVDKKDSDTIAKTVKEDSSGAYGASNDAQVGDLVEFKSEVSIAARSIGVVIHDTMDDGLTFTEGSIEIYTDEDMSTELDSDQYEIKGTPDTGDTFTIEIKDTFAATAAETQTLYVTYTATLNENAIDASGVDIVDQENTTTIKFGDGTTSAESTTTTTTHKFSVYKHAGGKNENLADAIFKLKKAGTALMLIKIDDTNYRIAMENEEGAVETFTTVASGDIVIWGVDSDSDYTLEETEPPAGYNKLAEDVEVTVNADNDNPTRQDIANNTGAELPSTGGMGTTILYIIGGILVVGGGIYLLTKKRMGKE